jgi:hypothetical protein
VPSKGFEIRVLTGERAVLRIERDSAAEMPHGQVLLSALGSDRREHVLRMVALAGLVQRRLQVAERS